MKTVLALTIAAVAVSATPSQALQRRQLQAEQNRGYDYIVVGGGAGGLVAADRLSETGKRILLIERGPPTTFVNGGRNGPEWAVKNRLTRYDVPGLCNQIWVDSMGIACTDIDQMAGCVLGGGTAINAGLFFHPPSHDWDMNFPDGWKASDVEEATSRVFKRIPSTDTPSKDGKRYLQESFSVLAETLTADGWKEVTANKEPNAKNRTYSHTPYMFSNGERGGPLATYLQTAKKRRNFKLVTNTIVNRVLRKGAQITGVDVSPTSNSTSALNGTITLNPGGKVILSAGTFGTPKVLFRSGIGPQDTLRVAKTAESARYPEESDWLLLPVGYNLQDHVNTDVVVSEPSVVPYDFYEAWENPIEKDKREYLKHRTGPLAGAAPAPNTMLWESFDGFSDGRIRQVQWTARVEGSLGHVGDNLITISQYLGTGMSSRGRLTMLPNLGIAVIQSPFAKTQDDVSAITRGVASLQKALSANPNITFLSPAPGQTAEQYVRQYFSGRRSNHWLGTAKLGADDGREKNGTAGSVVDLNAKVYGTNNLYVVDASIFPGHITGNPSAAIMIAAEHAVERILKL